jgi:ankyrin repeat protein
MALRQLTKQHGRTFLKEKKLSEETRVLFDLIFDDQAEALELHLQRHAGLLLNKKYDVKTQLAGTFHKDALTPLFFAFMQGKLKAAQVLLQKGVDPNIVCFVSTLSNYTPLQFFLEVTLEILKNTTSPTAPDVKKDVTTLLLLFLDANVDFRTKKDTTSNLYYLSLYSDFIELRFFIRLITKMKEGDKFKHWVNEGILDSGSSSTSESVPEKNVMFITSDKPLLILCQKRQVMLVELFLQNGADPNVQVSPGIPLLYFCLSTLLSFISTAPTFTKEDDEDRLRAVRSMTQGLRTAEDIKKAAQDHRALVDILITHLGERVKDKLLDDMTYLHLLAGYNNEEYTRKFCHLGLDVNAKRKSSGATPAHIAAESGTLAPLRVFVEEFKCDLTTHSSGSIELVEMKKEAIEESRNRIVYFRDLICTPLCSAFKYRMVATVNYLYAKLPRKDDANFMQFVAFSLAQWEDDAKREFLQQLPELNAFLESEARPPVTSNPLDIVNYIQLGKTQLVFEILRASQFAQNDFSDFLFTALSYQEKEIAKFLLEKYKDEFASLMRADARYAVASIAWASDLDLLRLVLVHGATVLGATLNDSPMHYAADANNADALALMLEYFPECVDHLSEVTSPLFLATSLGNQEACDVLLAHRAKPIASSTSTHVDMVQLEQSKTPTIASDFVKTESPTPKREKKSAPKLIDESAPPKEVAFFQPQPPPELFAWFGAVSTNNKNVVAITGGVRCFLYLDTKLLIAQGCHPDLITSAYDSPSFNGIKIKKLRWLNIQCQIRMRDKTLESSVEFEIRFRKTKARILLCPVRDETNKATLFIGCHYLPNGLHEVKDVRSLRKSFSHSSLIELTKVQCDKKQTQDMTLL